MTTEAQVCWQHLADAEAEHDCEHACRAYAELVRLGELVPDQRDHDGLVE